MKKNSEVKPLLMTGIPYSRHFHYPSLIICYGEMKLGVNIGVVLSVGKSIIFLSPKNK